MNFDSISMRSSSAASFDKTGNMLHHAKIRAALAPPHMNSEQQSNSAGPRSPAPDKVIRRFRVIPTLLALLAAGAAITTTSCKKAAPVPAPPTVEVVAVEQKDVPIYREWVGSLEGNVNATISAQVSGYLLRQDYTEGQPVKKGDVLFQIDDRTYRPRWTRRRPSWANRNWTCSATRRWRRPRPSASRNWTTPSRPISPTRPPWTPPG